ncbi:hypothetical protein [Streptomyces sp. I05A-00742]|uniref:hypothetical protein n=1 Tax=Streptomyces sp. I05A-00742 TaxID=2732853 RepID=UPI001487EFFB|nr:hypothetical protein [Streptomyces sp. I05A-00742]
MVFTALLIPPLLLGLIFALAGYEDRMLGEAPEPDQAPLPSERHLRVVPDLPADEPRLPDASPRRGGHRGRHAA